MNIYIQGKKINFYFIFDSLSFFTTKETKTKDDDKLGSQLIIVIYNSRIKPRETMNLLIRRHFLELREKPLKGKDKLGSSSLSFVTKKKTIKDDDELRS
jgi:hypothetical protein